MVSKSKVDNLYPPKQFNDSDVSKLLLTKERNIFIITRTSDESDKYKNFDELFSLYLSKLPSNNVKKYVSNIFSKQMIFIGASASSRNDAVFSRNLLTPDDKLTGVVLDSNVLDIDIKTGDTPSIDDCVYAAYYSLIRASILVNKDEVVKNLDLHKLLTTYVWHIILRSVGQKTIYNEKQKKLIHVACIYIYYRHFLNYKHPLAQRVIKKDYSIFFSKDELEEFLPLLDNVSKYGDIKFLPHVLNSLKTYNDNPSSLTLNLIGKLGNAGFYSYISSLDQLIALVVLSKYPTNLFPRTTLITDKIHEGVEDLIVKYIDKLDYQPTKLLASRGIEINK